MNMDDVFVTPNEMPDVVAAAAEAFAANDTLPFVEIDGVVVPNRTLFDD